MNINNKVCAYIEEATILLLKEKNIKDITIKEIVKRAGVCRASFYRNYTGVDDVLNSYIFSLEPLFLFNLENDLNLTLTHLFQKIYDLKDIFKIFINQKLYSYISSLFYNVTYESIVQLNVLNNKYQPFFFSGASNSVILAWMKNDFLETPEEMSKLFIKSLNGYLDI